MKPTAFFSDLQGFWRSRPLRLFRSWFVRFGSLHWWVARSWKFKVQFLIGLTALMLLLLSLAALRVYQNEYSRIADSFFRLQLFGPQEIFYSRDSESQGASNFCQFHIETRMPYGSALANTRIEATFKTMDGVPFWYHSDLTGADGTFQLPVPDMPMPKKVQMTIHAEDGKRNADFSAFLNVSPRPENVRFSLEEPKAEAETISVAENASFFQDVPLAAVAAEAFPLLANSPQSSASVMMTLPERVVSDPAISVSVLAARESRHPVFIGVWRENVLLACRPFAAGKQTRNVTLTLPESVSGLLSVLLIDFSVSPPLVLQHELAYRVPCEGRSEDSDAKTAGEGAANLPLEGVKAQFEWLKSYAAQLGTPKFRAEKQHLEFLPFELSNPEETQAGWNEIPKNPRLLRASDRLLGSALVPRIAAEHRFQIPELEPLQMVCDQLAPLSVFRSENESSNAGNADEGASEESIHSQMELALKIQTIYLNQNRTAAPALRAYRQQIPIVFDGLTELEQTYRKEVFNFRNQTQIRLGSLACLILCCASCLVLMMLMMLILGLPTDWRIWVLTLGVALGALGLSFLISNQSDVDRHQANTRYVTFSGTAPEPSTASQTQPKTLEQQK